MHGLIPVKITKRYLMLIENRIVCCVLCVVCVASLATAHFRAWPALVLIRTNLVLKYFSTSLLFRANDMWPHLTLLTSQ